MAHFIAKKWICKSPQCQIVCDNLWQMWPADCEGWVREHVRPLHSEVCILVRICVLPSTLLFVLAFTRTFTLCSVYTGNSACGTFHSCALKVVICSRGIRIRVWIYRHEVVNMTYTNFRFHRCPFIARRLGTEKRRQQSGLLHLEHLPGALQFSVPPCADTVSLLKFWAVSRFFCLCFPSLFLLPLLFFSDIWTVKRGCSACAPWAAGDAQGFVLLSLARAFAFEFEATSLTAFLGNSVYLLYSVCQVLFGNVDCSR